MAAMALPLDVYLALSREWYSCIKENIAGVAGLELQFPIKLWGKHNTIGAFSYNNKPYGVFLLASLGNAKEVDDKSVRSLFSDITRDYPSMKIVIQLQLRGLDSKVHKDTKDIEHRVRRISQQSGIQVWAHNGVKFNKDHASSAKSLPRDGELRLPLLSENAEDKAELVLPFFDILDVVRKLCEGGVPLLGHPDNKDPRAPNISDNKGLRSSVFPLDALKSGFAAGIAKLLAPHAQELKAGGVRFQARGGGGGGNVVKLGSGGKRFSLAPAGGNTSDNTFAKIGGGVGKRPISTLSALAAFDVVNSNTGGYGGGKRFLSGYAAHRRPAKSAVFRPRLPCLVKPVGAITSSWSRLLARLPRKV